MPLSARWFWVAMFCGLPFAETPALMRSSPLHLEPFMIALRRQAVDACLDMYGLGQVSSKNL